MKVFGARKEQVENLMQIIRLFLMWLYINELVTFKPEMPAKI
jgi:hypothetical protein